MLVGKNQEILYEKYANDFMRDLELCEKSGARKLWGNGRITSENMPNNFLGNPDEGVYMWPHVYADVTEDMECFHEEIFGPVITIVKAKDFDHALHLANASPYGLSSAIYTNDRLEAYRYKTGIKAGRVVEMVPESLEYGSLNHILIGTQ